jgi:hypothetical protein
LHLERDVTAPDQIQTILGLSFTHQKLADAKQQIARTPDQQLNLRGVEASAKRMLANRML